MYWIFAYFTFPQKPFYKMKYLPTYRIYLQIVLKVNHCSKICIHTQWQCTNRFYSKPLVVLEVDCKTNFTLLHSQTFDLRTMSTSKWFFKSLLHFQLGIQKQVQKVAGKVHILIINVFINISYDKTVYIYLAFPLMHPCTKNILH